MICVISINKDTKEAIDFNNQLQNLCEKTKTRFIDLQYKNLTHSKIFKQLSCFFHKNMISMSEAFAISE